MGGILKKKVTKNWKINLKFATLIKFIENKS